MNMRYLLDVNVWVALFDDAHTHSAIANAFIAKRGIKIATCPLVENGVVRVMNVPQYGRGGAVGLERVRDQLRHATATLKSEFWPDDISIRDDEHINLAKVHGHNQITDAYLLALAVKHGGRFVTLDRGAWAGAVRGGQEGSLVVV